MHLSVNLGGVCIMKRYRRVLGVIGLLWGLLQTMSLYGGETGVPQLPLISISTAGNEITKQTRENQFAPAKPFEGHVSDFRSLPQNSQETSEVSP